MTKQSKLLLSSHSNFIEECSSLNYSQQGKLADLDVFETLNSCSIEHEWSQDGSCSYLRKVMWRPLTFQFLRGSIPEFTQILRLWICTLWTNCCHKYWCKLLIYRSSKLITTSLLVGLAWQLSTKPCSASHFSRVKFFSMTTLPCITLARHVQHTPPLQE